MFFILSKVFWFFAQPLNFAIILMGLTFLLLVGRWRCFAMVTAGIAFLVLGLGAWTTLGALIINPLENRFHRPDTLPEKVDGIIILGGGFEGGVNLVRGGYELNASGDRFVEAAILARKHPEAKIVVTGGTGTLMLEGEADGVTAPRLLTALGIAPERLILESQSRNTYENAVFTKQMVDAKSGETWLLISSAFHMPRSMGLFRKAGFEVVPWPSDYRASGAETIGLAEDNPQDSLQNMAIGLREWAGLLAYWLAGRTDQLLPAP